MKNPFESLTTRRGKFEKTQEKSNEQEKEKDELESPLGHLATNNIFANMCHETLNVLASVPFLPKIKYLEWRIRVAQKKMEDIYTKDEAEGIRLNQRYDSLIREAVKSGDETKVRVFEKEKLGMEEENTSEEVQ